jgi:glycolate oxidase FAD binding subunit
MVFRPRSHEELSSVLRAATEGGLRVVPRGGGTTMCLGGPVDGVDAVILTADFNRVVELNEENLTVTAEAGVTWADLQEALAQCGRGYEVPLDPPKPEHATVGGVLASAFSGHRQILHGAIRNMVLGLKAMTPQGDVVDFGGKTVKNVAGLDMCKVFLGSLGTLGVLLEATLRCLPLPSARMTVLARGEAEGLWNLVEAVRTSSLYPSALSWIPGCLLARMDLQRFSESELIAIALEGSEAGVKERWRRLASLGAKADLKRMDDEHATELWARIRDSVLPPSTLKAPLSLRATIPPSRSRELAQLLQQKTPYLFLVHPGTGAAWAHWELEENEMNPEDLTIDLRGAIRAWEGHLLVNHAPAAWKHRLDIWGLHPTSRAIMTSLKTRIDPDNLMAPCRLG